KVLTAAQMREVDRLTTERHGIPGIQLMENAAAQTIQAAEARFGSLSGKNILIFSGRGNNGGDGAAIARQLLSKNASVALLLLGRVSETKGDARTNFDRAAGLGSSHPQAFKLVEVLNADQLTIEATSSPRDICFDALLGTGLGIPAEGLFQSA